MRHPTGDERQQSIVGGRQGRLDLGDGTIKLSAREQQRKCLRPFRRHPVIHSGVLSSNSAPVFEQSVEMSLPLAGATTHVGTAALGCPVERSSTIGANRQSEIRSVREQCPAKPAQLR